MPACGDIQGLWDQSEVNIGWYGYICSAKTWIRSGPGFGYPGRVIVSEGKRLGAQSIRNPEARDNPPRRLNAFVDNDSGWIWIYMLDGGHTGWINYLACQPYGNGKAWARGPAGVDFHVLMEPCPGKGKPIGCGGSRQDGRIRRVTESTEEVYLRYAPQSTAFHFLHGGDSFKDLYHSPLNYRGIEVVSARGVPAGTRGWILESVIE